MRQTIYYGGDILTMEEPLYAPALAVEDGMIGALGAKAELMKRYPDAELVDLCGQTLLPAFLDPHSHITALASTLRLLPLEDVSSIEALGASIADYARSHPRTGGQWITGFGYDHNRFPDRRHPTRQVLDAACPDRPVLIAHASGHMGVANSAALRALGVDADTPDPAGGVIGREADGRTPNGYLEETAFSGLTARIPQPTTEELCSSLVQAQNIYFENGITTIQDGITKQGDWALLRAAAESGRLEADVVCYLDLEHSRLVAEQYPQYRKNYCNRLKIGGYKIFLDGSPQGRTAWMTQPYEGADDGYRGYPTHTDEAVRGFVAAARKDGMQLLTHCNGDAAAQQLIDACASCGDPDSRNVMIHAQLVRRDQLPAMHRLGLIVSFFAAHIWHWGDVHLQNFGDQRAQAISPARTAIDTGVVYTFHQDSPVIRPNMIETIWCAVNRISGAGHLLGEQERISPLEALRGVTVNAAYQYFEEDRKGSLHPGKLADLVILDQNPLNISPHRLREIRVMRTIKEGKTVYLRH